MDRRRAALVPTHQSVNNVVCGVCVCVSVWYIKLSNGYFYLQPSPAAEPSPSSDTTGGDGVSEARVRALVADALETFAADKIALADYALYSAGACK